MRFNVGDSVVCITPISRLEEGKIYEVESVKSDLEFGDSIALVGLQGSYLDFRFKPVEHLPTTSISYGYPTYGINETIDSVITNTSVNHIDAEMLEVKASKNDSDKIDLSLIPKISSIEHAKAFMVGEKKYGRYNYCKGHKASQLIAAAKRHLDAWFEGEDHDPVDGQHHLGSVMACCSMILRQEELGTLKDDRYTGVQK